MRIGLPLALLGLVCLTTGLVALDAANRALRPRSVALGALEPGTRGYLELGSHVRLFPLVVYASAGQPGDTRAALHHAYYPVIAPRDDYLGRLQRLIAQHGTVQQVPPDQLFGGTPPFRLLVKTRRFATLAAVPHHPLRSESLRGVTLSQAELLEPELAQLRHSYPATDLHKVVILSENAAPTDRRGRGWALIGGGAALLLIGLLLWLAGRRR